VSHRTDEEGVASTSVAREAASRVGPLLDQYIRLSGCTQADDPQDEAPYVDLVADVLHLAASRGVDHEHLLKTATMHFEAEANPPDTLAP
jgi:hypothetical protein